MWLYQQLQSLDVARHSLISLFDCSTFLLPIGC